MFSVIGHKIIEFEQLTRTALEAATALGCDVGQIAKSIIFKTDKELPVLVVASGANRIDEKKIEKIIGTKIFKADAEFVRKNSGYVIGGVPPWGHKILPTTIIDNDLKKYEHIYAAAGKNNAVFKLTFEELVEKTKGMVVKVC